MNRLHQRLEQVLEAYGASPDRWPDEDRAALLSLLETSDRGRALRDEAARLDALLDSGAEIAPPSNEVFERILGAAPEAPGRQAGDRATWRWVALIPVAAAAGLALWMAGGPTRSAVETPADPSMQIALTDLGIYTTPTDVLLEIDGFDPLASVPTYDCDDSDWGCLDLGPELEESERQSMQGESRRMTT